MVQWQKQLKCLATEEWKNKMWYMYKWLLFWCNKELSTNPKVTLEYAQREARGVRALILLAVFWSDAWALLV